MIVKAPGVVKLFGEHPRSLYMPKDLAGESLAVVAAIGVYATSNVERIAERGRQFVLDLPDMKIRHTVANIALLEEIYDLYVLNGNVETIARESGRKLHAILPHLIVAGRIASGEIGVDIGGLKVAISSDIPRESGVASSSATAVALTVSLLMFSGIQDDNVIIDIARDADRVVHKTQAGGMLDVPPSYFGGCMSYSSMRGLSQEPIDPNLGIVVINTGPKKSTGEMVSHVKSLYRTRRGFAEGVLDEKERCAAEGLAALRRDDLKSAGELMLLNHELLGKLGVSTPRLDAAVALAKRGGALGAKLSGGGGGGAVVAIAENPDKLATFMNKNGYKSFATRIAPYGAFVYMLR